MARREKTVIVEAKGRDAGKAFHIREMSAMDAEDWAMRALLALAKSDIELPDDFMSLGLNGIAIVGVKALGKMDPLSAKPLLAEMLACVEFQPNPAQPAIRRPLAPDDIEEVATLLWLRREVVNLHVDFFTSGAVQRQVAVAE